MKWCLKLDHTYLVSLDCPGVALHLSTTWRRSTHPATPTPYAPRSLLASPCIPTPNFKIVLSSRIFLTLAGRIPPILHSLTKKQSFSGVASWSNATGAFLSPLRLTHSQSSPTNFSLNCWRRERKTRSFSSQDDASSRMNTRADFEELVLTECLVTRWPHVRTQTLCSTARVFVIRQIRAVANTLNHENSPLGAGTLENSFFLQLDDVGDRGGSSCIPFAPEF